MHKFLRAIGFTDFRKKDLEIITNEIIEKPEVIKVTKDSQGNEFAELSREFAPNIGLKVVGNFEEDSDNFEIDYYYPYIIGFDKTTDESVEVERHIYNESYAGVCDDPKVGVTLIFFLHNVADFLSEHRGKSNKPVFRGAYLSGLSVDGKILLPVQAKELKEQEIPYKKNNDRSKLVAKAREGNEEAIESLTLEDMDTYSLLSKRIMKEDIFSIVSTSFIPYGIECDQYSIVATILEYERIQNSITNEGLHRMKVECNDLIFEICINEKDLEGEPAIGRRFKGTVWMQGSVCL